MKIYEYIGVVFSIVAYCLIVTGNYAIGFETGLLASSALLIYFGTIESFASVGLQLFFIGANMFGLYNLGILSL